MKGLRKIIRDLVFMSPRCGSCNWFVIKSEKEVIGTKNIFWRKWVRSTLALNEGIEISSNILKIIVMKRLKCDRLENDSVLFDIILSFHNKNCWLWENVLDTAKWMFSILCPKLLYITEIVRVAQNVMRKSYLHAIEALFLSAQLEKLAENDFEVTSTCQVNRSAQVSFDFWLSLCCYKLYVSVWAADPNFLSILYIIERRSLQIFIGPRGFPKSTNVRIWLFKIIADFIKHGPSSNQSVYLQHKAEELESFTKNWFIRMQIVTKLSASFNTAESIELLSEAGSKKIAKFSIFFGVVVVLLYGISRTATFIKAFRFHVCLNDRF